MGQYFTHPPIKVEEQEQPEVYVPYPVFSDEEDNQGQPVAIAKLYDVILKVFDTYFQQENKFHCIHFSSTKLDRPYKRDEYLIDSGIVMM